MGTKLGGLLLVLAAVLAAAGPAAAHDHTPPEAVLVTGTDSGSGASYGATWAKRDGRYCAVMVADGLYGFEGPPVQWVPSSEIAVRFETRHRPARVLVRGFLFGDPTTGTAIYGRIRVPHELRKVEVSGKTMWEAVLSPPPWPDLWLDVTADWKDVDGCHPQHAGWTFRAGLLPI